jgi:hypothetical protein
LAPSIRAPSGPRNARCLKGPELSGMHDSHLVVNHYHGIVMKKHDARPRALPTTRARTKSTRCHLMRMARLSSGKTKGFRDPRCVTCIARPKGWRRSGRANTWPIRERGAWHRLEGIPPMSALTSSPLSADERAVIARVVDDAPPIPQATKARLAALLKGVATGPDHVTDKLAATIRRGAAA